MECPKCHDNVEKVYIQKAVAGAETNVCLKCLAIFLWDSTHAVVDEETDTLFTIEANDAKHFLSGLKEVVAIDDHRKLYRQTNSNNMIIVKQTATNSTLKCLDVTLDINEAN